MLKLLAFIAILLYLPFLLPITSPISFKMAHAAIAFITSHDGTILSDNTSFTFSSINLDDSTDCIVANCALIDFNGLSTNCTATWDGGAMTFVAQGQSDGGGDDPVMCMFILENPNDDGSGDLVISFTDTVDTGYCHFMEFSGVDQTTPQDVAAIVSADSSPNDTDGASILTASANTFIVGGVMNKDDTDLRQASGFTETQFESSTDAGSDAVSVVFGYESIPTAGLEDFTATNHGPTNDDMVAIVLALREASAVAASRTTDFLSFFN